MNSGIHQTFGRRPSIGIVGCGYWGAKHVRVLCGLSEVGSVVVVDTNPACRQFALSTFPAVRVFAELEEALPEIDAVIIATPPVNHAEVALKALRAGKHVLTEKPLATTSADAQAMIEEAERSKTILMVGHTFEFNPAVRELRRRMQQDELGKIYYLHSSRLNLGLYRSDVNVVWDLAPHDISIFNYLLRSKPTMVSAWGSSHASIFAEDLAYVRLHYEAIGVIGYVHVSWLDPQKVRRITAVGSRKMAVYDDIAEERLRIFDRGLCAGDDQPGLHERPLSYRYGDVISPHLPAQEPLQLEDQHFVHCIQTGTVPDTDAWSGLNVLLILEAIDHSLRTQRPQPIEWSEDTTPAIQRDRLTAEVKDSPVLAAG